MVINAAVQQQVISKYRIVLDFLLSFFQILYFAAHEDFDEAWKNESSSSSLSTFSSVFHLYPILNNLPEYFFDIIYVVIMLVVAATYLLFIAAYFDSKRESSHSWPTVILSRFFTVLLTFAYIPLQGTLIAGLGCNNGELVAMPGYSCWSMKHTLLVAFGILCILLLLLLQSIIALIFFSTSSGTKNCIVRVPTIIILLEQLLKTVLLIFSILIRDEKIKQWLIGLTLIAGYAYFLTRSFFRNIFLMGLTNLVWLLYVSLSLWSGASLLLAVILNNIEFNAAVELFSLGCVLVTALLLSFNHNTKYMDIHRTPREELTGELMEYKIRLLIEIWSNQDMGREYEVLYKGYITHHIEKCSDHQCPFSSVYRNQKTDESSPGKQANRKKQSLHLQMMNYFNIEFMYCIDRKPDCIQLRLAYALFMIEKMRNSYVALNEISNCENLNPSFTHQYMIYRYQKLVKEVLIAGSKGEGDRISVAAAIAYDAIFKKFKRKLEKTSLLYTQLWSLLGEDSPDVMKTMEVGFRILENNEAITKIWEQMHSLIPNVPKALKLYAGYLFYVVNDREMGKVLIAKSEDFTLIKGNMGKKKLFSQSLGENSDFSGDGTACVFLNGQIAKIGVITECNLSFCREFGYVKKELIGKNIKFLMPLLFGNLHDEIMQQSAEYNEETSIVSRSDRLVFGLQKNGFIFPIWLRIASTPTILNNSNYIGLLHVDKSLANSEICFILLDRKLQMCGVSSSALSMMELNHLDIKREPLSLSEFIPNFERKELQSFMTKTGKPVKFYYPYPASENIFGFSENVTLNPTTAGKINKRIVDTTRCATYNCSVEEVTMGEHGKIGYIAKLSVAPEQDPGEMRKTRKIPNFQFIYDDYNNRYVRDIKVQGGTGYRRSDSTASVGHRLERNQSYPESQSSRKHHEETEKEQPRFGSISEEIFAHLEEVDPKSKLGFYPSIRTRLMQMIKYMEEKMMESHIGDIAKYIIHKRLNFGEQVTTYRLINGEQVLLNDENQIYNVSSMTEEDLFVADEDEHHGRSETKEGQSISQIRSREALHARITEAAQPKQLTYLLYISILIALGIAGFAIGIYVVCTNTIDNSGEGLKLLDYIFRMQANFHYSLFNIKECIMASNGESDLISFVGSGSTSTYQTFLKKEMAELIDIIFSGKEYLEQDAELSQRSDELNSLLVNSNFLLNYFLDENKTAYRAYTFSETVMTMISNLNEIATSTSNLCYDTDYHSRFFLYNGYNSFYKGIMSISESIYSNIENENKGNTSTSITLFVLALCLAAAFVPVSLLLLAYVYMDTDTILLLFLDLPYSSIKILISRGEAFVQGLLYENTETDSVSNAQDQGLELMNFSFGSLSIKRSRQYKNTPEFIRNAIIVLVATFFVISGYFSLNFYLGAYHSAQFKDILDIFNITVRLESSCIKGMNFQKECLYQDVNLTINSRNKCTVAMEEIDDVYQLHKRFGDLNNDNELASITTTNLCSSPFGIIPNLFGTSTCAQFLETTPVQGITVLLAYYIKLLRQLAMYSPSVRLTALQQTEFRQIYLLQTQFVKPFMRALNQYIIDDEHNDERYLINLWLGILLSFLFTLFFCFIILWIPYISGTKLSIERTKLMLTLIPIELLLKTRSISNYIQQHLTK